MPDINESLAAGSPFVYRLIQKTQHNSHTSSIFTILNIPIVFFLFLEYQLQSPGALQQISMLGASLPTLTNPIILVKCVSK